MDWPPTEPPMPPCMGIYPPIDMQPPPPPKPPMLPPGMMVLASPPPAGPLPATGPTGDVLMGIVILLCKADMVFGRQWARMKEAKAS